MSLQPAFKGITLTGSAALAILAACAVSLVPMPSLAQSLSLNLGESSGSTTGRAIQLLALMTVLSVAPSVMVMVTAFTRIIVVLHFIRQAVGTQTSPPNMVISGLALFLTAFVMQPTLEKAYQNGVVPLMAGEIDETEAFDRIVLPFHGFMSHNVRHSDVDLFMNISHTKAVTRAEDVPLKVLVPAFIISELRRSFEIGFLIYIPFVIIDMVIASVLMSMGMMMLPPSMLSMPFKLIFFVLVDGWGMIAGSLTQSFNP
ncbi:MAG: flagellar type III secretion system pore protein FliP [Alphaproteobacteria bacterium]|nr:flagellar type III secretion system pore protein FliP [Alphaproteobacteria bacterium]